MDPSQVGSGHRSSPSAFSIQVALVRITKPQQSHSHLIMRVVCFFCPLPPGLIAAWGSDPSFSMISSAQSCQSGPAMVAVGLPISPTAFMQSTKGFDPDDGVDQFVGQHVRDTRRVAQLRVDEDLERAVFRRFVRPALTDALPTRAGRREPDRHANVLRDLVAALLEDRTSSFGERVQPFFARAERRLAGLEFAGHGRVSVDHGLRAHTRHITEL